MSSKSKKAKKEIEANQVITTERFEVFWNLIHFFSVD